MHVKKDRMRKHWGLISIAFVVACATGCGGGGSGGSGNALLPQASKGLTTFTVTSNPSGLAVTSSVGGGSGTTPYTTTPLSSSGAYTYTVTPTNGNQPFTFTVNQSPGPNETLFYNQVTDTSGSIGTIATSSAARSTARGSGATSAILRRAPLLANRPSTSSTLLAVHYDVAQLQSSNRRVDDIERSAGASVAWQIGPVQNGAMTRAVSVADASALATVTASLRGAVGVTSVESVQLRYPQTTNPVTPNDPLFEIPDQWSMLKIRMPNAWGYTTGSTSIPIADIDTGADVQDPDLTSLIDCAHSELDLNGSTTTGCAAVQDQDGHGTSTASIADAQANNGFGFAGVAYQSSLQIYKIFPNPTAPSYENAATYGSTTVDEAQAMYDAVANGARVINLSLGSPASGGPDPTEQAAIQYALAHGVVVVAAAGNNAENAVSYPAAYPGVIAVGASALNDGNGPNPSYASATEYIASYSNYGPGMTLLAPGGDPASSQTLPNATFDALQWIETLSTTTAANPADRCGGTPCIGGFAGTSQATPHVTGAVALMLSLNGTLTPPQVSMILRNTADDIGDPKEGSGRLDVYRALAAVKGDPSPPQAPTQTNFVAFAYTNSGGTVPHIIDTTYTKGVAVSSAGAFRIPDIPANSGPYKIGVWADTNGDGIVDAGDSFGASATCPANASCTTLATGITVHPVTAGFVLP